MSEARRHCLTTRYGVVTAFEFRPATRFRHTVLVLHGWASRTEFMKALIEGCRDAGYRVVSLDLPGHGHSAGRKLTMASAVEAVHAAEAWLGPFDAVIGHSFGGAVAVNSIAGSVSGTPPLDAGRLVLIAAPSSMPAIFRHYGQALNLGKRSYDRFAAGVEAIAGRPLAYYVGADRLAELVVPTLVLHASDDREVSADEARRYAGAGGHVRLQWADGLGHRRILSDPGVVTAVVGFLTGAGLMPEE